MFNPRLSSALASREARILLSVSVNSRSFTTPEDEGQEEAEGPVGAEGGPERGGYGVASHPPSCQSPNIGPCAVGSRSRLVSHFMCQLIC